MNKTTIKRKTCFTAISNALINDSALSWKAKGILIYMLSKPEIKSIMTQNNMTKVNDNYDYYDLRAFYGEDGL